MISSKKYKKKICIFTGSRAEYGLLYNLLNKLNKDQSIELQIIVSGSHTSKKFGNTYKEIQNDGFKISSKIAMNLNSDTPNAICEAMGNGLGKISRSITKLNPDILILLGDRYEALCAAISATINRVPIAHFHGGESTEGLWDESFRHSITKMSQFHFVAHNQYKKKVIQLGENPKNIFTVGGMGVDNIVSLKFLSKIEVEKELKIKYKKKNILVTFHPVTLEVDKSEIYIQNLLKALNFFDDINIIFTMPNSDIDNEIIFKKINEYVLKNKKRASFHVSLGRLKYLSVLKYVDAVIGNSSSGLLEAPSFKIATVNIGDRQGGRIKASSVIDSEIDSLSIIRSIKKVYSKKFKLSLKNTKNPYGKGNASLRSYKILKKINLKDILKKNFFEIKQ